MKLCVKLSATLWLKQIKMKKILLLSLAIQLLIVLQTKSQVYIKKDSTITYLTKIIDANDYENSLICRVEINDNIIQYSPLDITEYKTNDGRLYISHQINYRGTNQNFFLEKLVNDSVSLYYLKTKNEKVFFIEKQKEQIQPIFYKNLKDFHTQLTQLTNDCNNLTFTNKKVKPTKKSMIKYMTFYKKCKSKPFPYANYSFYFGLSKTQLNATNAIENSVNQRIEIFNDKNFNFGFAVDLPINVSFFSLHSELNYSQNNFYGYTPTNDIFINFQTLNIPLSIRYVYTNHKLQPFINAGGLFSYNFKYTQKVIETIYKDKNIFLNTLILPNALPKTQIGITSSIGIFYQTKTYKRYFIELRYNQFYNTQFNKKDINLNLGFNF